MEAKVDQGEEVKESLSNEEISRYSRQMILPELGLKGQLLLRNSSVLIVGVGGLGSPAAMFLASSGIGVLGLVDYDIVERSNLHRQVIHGEKTLNISKCESAKQFIQNLNPNIQIRLFHKAFDNSNALDIVKQFDVVMDCTDNAATRYLLNDACVLSNKPLISGSALRFEGQLTTYNFQNGPCYRCIFPVPPPPEFVTNCSDGGVIGAVPGIIGTLQALEAIKLISNIGPSYSGKMLIFDGIRGTFTNVTLRSKQKTCSVCSDNRTMTDLLEDYAFFCGSGFNDKEKGVQLLEKEDRITPEEYDKIVKSEVLNGTNKHLLLDVREPQELEICSLPSVSMNIPFSQLHSEKSLESLSKFLEQQCEISSLNPLHVYVVCRRGNDSQRAVKVFREKFASTPFSGTVKFKDIQGGLQQWACDVDKEFPVY